MHTVVRFSVAAAVSALALTYATQSRADDTTTTATDGSVTTTQSTSTTTPATTTTTTPATTTPAAQTNVTVQPPAASTTTTTAAPYIVSGGDYGEREIKRYPNRSLLSTGTGLFVVSYGASVVTAAISDRDEDKKLFIPVVGPWMDLADRNCDVRGCGGNEDVNKAMIITSGVVQGAGVLLAISSLFVPEKVEERRLSAKAKEVKPEVRVTPVSFAAGAGAGVVGRF